MKRKDVNYNKCIRIDAFLLESQDFSVFDNISSNLSTYKTSMKIGWFLSTTDWPVTAFNEVQINIKSFLKTMGRSHYCSLRIRRNSLKHKAVRSYIFPCARIFLTICKSHKIPFCNVVHTVDLKKCRRHNFIAWPYISTSAAGKAIVFLDQRSLLCILSCKYLSKHIFGRFCWHRNQFAWLPIFCVPPKYGIYCICQGLLFFT